MFLWQGNYVIDVGSSQKRRPQFMKWISPCLTRGRAQQRGFFSTSLQRPLSTDDCIRLQGVLPKHVRCKGVTPRQLRGMAGNAWSLNVAAKILTQLVCTLGLASHDELQDPWR